MSDEEISSERKQMLDEKHRHLESEVGGLKGDVAGLKTDVGGIKTDIGILTQSNQSMKGEMTLGFRALRDDFKESRNQTPKMGVGVLLSLLSVFVAVLGFLGFVVVSGVAAFWAAVMLLFIPLDEKVEAHKNTTGDMPERMSLIEEKAAENRIHIDQSLAEANKASIDRNDHQQEKLDRLLSRQDILFEDRLKNAYLNGKFQAYHEWVRDDAEAIKEDLHQHARQPYHATGGSTNTELSRLKGMVETLMEKEVVPEVLESED